MNTTTTTLSPAATRLFEATLVGCAEMTSATFGSPEMAADLIEIMRAGKAREHLSMSISKGMQKVSPEVYEALSSSAPREALLELAEQASKRAESSVRFADKQAIYTALAEAC